jgi:hypothetical protein
MRWDDSQGEVERFAVELPGELCDRRHPVYELLVVEWALDHGGRVAASFTGSLVVFGELEPEQAAQPGQVAGQLHVSVDHLGVHVGVQHRRCPSAEYRVVVLHEDRDLVVKALSLVCVGEELA